jgi:hypothetical protein
MIVEIPNQRPAPVNNDVTPRSFSMAPSVSKPKTPAPSAVRNIKDIIEIKTPEIVDFQQIKGAETRGGSAVGAFELIMVFSLKEL